MAVLLQLHTRHRLPTAILRYWVVSTLRIHCVHVLTTVLLHVVAFLEVDHRTIQIHQRLRRRQVLPRCASRSSPDPRNLFHVSGELYESAIFNAFRLVGDSIFAGRAE